MSNTATSQENQHDGCSAYIMCSATSMQAATANPLKKCRCSGVAPKVRRGKGIKRSMGSLGKNLDIENIV